MNVKVAEFLGLVLQINHKNTSQDIALVLVNDRGKLFKTRVILDRIEFTLPEPTVTILGEVQTYLLFTTVLFGIINFLPEDVAPSMPLR